jgi:hypothetical protein
MAETLASYSVPEHHVRMFTDNIRGVLQRRGGKIVPWVSRGSYRGSKIQVVNFIGPVEFIERSSPYGDTKLTELEHTQRWITGAEYDVAVLVDRLDTLKMIYDPTSPYVERFREAAARKQDQIIMDKFFATAKTGVDGNTDTIFPVGNIIAHGAVNLILTKLRTLRKLVKKNHVDLMSARPKIAVTAEQIDSLIAETTTSSVDFNAIKPLVDGEIATFMGFDFIGYEEFGGKGIPKDTSSGVVRLCPVWVPDGMHFGTWEDLVITINNRPDKNNIKQIHGTFTSGATRLEENKVYQLQCKES